MDVEPNHFFSFKFPVPVRTFHIGLLYKAHSILFSGTRYTCATTICKNFPFRQTKSGTPLIGRYWDWLGGNWLSVTSQTRRTARAGQSHRISSSNSSSTFTRRANVSAFSFLPSAYFVVGNSRNNRPGFNRTMSLFRCLLYLFVTFVGFPVLHGVGLAILSGFHIRIPYEPLLVPFMHFLHICSLN